MHASFRIAYSGTILVNLHPPPRALFRTHKYTNNLWLVCGKYNALWPRDAGAMLRASTPIMPLCGIHTDLASDDSNDDGCISRKLHSHSTGYASCSTLHARSNFSPVGGLPFRKTPTRLSWDGRHSSTSEEGCSHCYQRTARPNGTASVNMRRRRLRHAAARQEQGRILEVRYRPRQISGRS
jgi:hypothetical protein